MFLEMSVHRNRNEINRVAPSRFIVLPSNPSSRDHGHALHVGRLGREGNDKNRRGPSRGNCSNSKKPANKDTNSYAANAPASSSSGEDERLRYRCDKPKMGCPARVTHPAFQLVTAAVASTTNICCEVQRFDAHASTADSVSDMDESSNAAIEEWIGNTGGVYHMTDSL